ncbi:hypothetical protein IMG5_155150 [Ichthyophthirius multifiliis]|uniref:FHA domain protein n=1 Tax=Ichthyophthirius multifiliis TaxID=5932 RepID=G0QZ90_ICHMU|nr:hypothetical protein IMG5_155150 [Ichthyophthirius multifiliis]EGR29473.1 hypothetical protein IMG5_155150 [Ichthyophthirius multifiliis]|eukprot:XP_004030709.1 hypothetical protein IMG5_155150 [Ichthyophthirius multifiliis]
MDQPNLSKNLQQILPKDPLQWNIKDTLRWLQFIGLECYQEQFSKKAFYIYKQIFIYFSIKAQNAIDGSCLKVLTEVNLIQIGITNLTHLSKINMWIKVGLDDYSGFLKNNLNSFDQRQNQNWNSQLQQIENQQQYTIKEIGNIQKEKKVEKEKEKVYEERYELILSSTWEINKQFFKIKENGAKIGKASQNQIVLFDYQVQNFHSEITFEKDQFFMKDLQSQSGTFIKIKDRLELQEGLFFELGSQQLLVSQLSTKKQPFVILNQLINNPNPNRNNWMKGESHKLYFKEISETFQENNGKFITIGRKVTNQLNFQNDLLMSLEHAKIFLIQDHFFIEDQSSTNGTWIKLQSGQIYSIQDMSQVRIGSTFVYNCQIKKYKEEVQCQDNLCSICFVNERQAVFLPCRHFACCIYCCKSLKKCVICRLAIQDFVKVYNA